jgi:parallel beta-helix repeat protein
MKTAAFTLCLLLLLSASILMLEEYSSVWAFDIVESQSSNADYEVLTIYIKSDGSVEGTDLIERNGNVYTFKGDIGVYNQTISANTYLGGIVVERDNIVIDGAGYKLTGSGLYGSISPFGDPPIKIHSPGIDTTGRSNVVIKNLTVQAFRYGIMLLRSTNITVLNSEILRNYKGVDVYNSEQLTLVNCKIHDPGYGLGYGVYLQNATCCLIYNNTFTNITYGINGDYSSAGIYSDHNVIANNQFIRNDYAIRMGASSYNIFASNVIQNGSYWLPEYDVWLPGEGISIGGEGNIVCGNHISGNEEAIKISGNDNLFYGNSIADNDFGVVLHGAKANMTFYGNNFINNENDVQAINLYSFPTEFDVLGFVFLDNGSVGNYWSSYNGSDLNLDGVGDTPYNLRSEMLTGSFSFISKEADVVFGVDNFPLMSPVEISSGYDDLPLWAVEKLVSLGLIEDSAVQSDVLPVAAIAAVSTVSAVIVLAGLIVYFRKRHDNKHRPQDNNAAAQN